MHWNTGLRHGYSSRGHLTRTTLLNSPAPLQDIIMRVLSTVDALDLNIVEQPY
jgi:hypothetical protein